jgi:hypothetical protein
VTREWVRPSAPLLARGALTHWPAHDATLFLLTIAVELGRLWSSAL